MYARKKTMIDALLQKINVQYSNQPFVSGSTSELNLRSIIYKVFGQAVKLTPDVEMCLIKLHLLYAFANEELVEPKMLYEFLHKKRNEEIILVEYPVDEADFFDKEEYDR